ncbi:hypothetical protein FAES_1019 [Fibrella aestuarina BUZ 2]|uniref:Glycosyl hydrolase BNR repeat-containing protein n=1 Tax=Fibrella aestuarina BUZ 2 TaxID=1166018 RepID=I0K4H7_9BACT|nr:T9SS type A sorting domain-containing protein [Fibrella aestuarina]CCG99030.1 hypothetical protein FAES_1019 [Fibrella aestuarina BUZ 2]
MPTRLRLLGLLYFWSTLLVQAQQKPYQLLMQDEKVRYSDVKKAFEKARELDERAKKKAVRQARRKGLPDPVFEENEEEAKFYRWERWRLRHLAPDGTEDVASPAQEFTRFDRQQVAAVRSGSKRARQGATPAWRELGPFQTQTTAAYNNAAHYLYGYNVGRLGAVAFHPTDANTIYTAAPGRNSINSGGIWKTTNGGTSWTPLFDQYPNMIVTDVAVSAKNPQTVYATGNHFAVATVGGGTAGYGIEKSTDGGANWQHIPFLVQYETNTNGSKAYVGRALSIDIDPADDQHLIATTQRAILYSTNGGLLWQKATTPVADRLADYVDIAFKPGDPQTVYVSGAGKEQVLRSTDGGKTFTQLPLPEAVEVGTVGRVELAVSAAQPDFLYLLTTMGTERHGGLYRLNTATGDLRTIVARGKSFATQQQTRDDTQLYYCLSLAVSPTDTGEIHVGMVPLMSTFDGGRTWEYRHSWATSRAGDVHSDISSLDFQPGTNRLFVTSDGGLNAATGKRGAAFRFYDNIAVSQIYFLAQPASLSDRMIIGLQDNGTKMYENGLWKQVGGGDGISCLIDDANPSVYYVTSQNGYLLRFTGPASSSYITPTGVTDENTSFYTPIDYHQATKTLFIGSNTLWRKNENNFSSAWERVKDFDSKEMIQDVFVAPSDVKTIYVRTYSATTSYRLYVTTDAGQTWDKVLGDGFDAYITALTIHPQDAKTIYASRYRTVSPAGYFVMKSSDYGRTWTDITGNLPKVSGNAITVQEGTDEGVYVAMDQGVYYKDNTMSQWTRYGTGLPNSPVYDMRVDYTGSKLKAATHGRGVWEVPLAVPVGQVTSLITAKRDVCAGTSMGVTYQVTKGATGPNTYAIQLSDASGSFASPTLLASTTATTADVTIPGTLARGAGYQIRVLRNNNIATADTSDAFSVLTLPKATLNGPAEVVYGSPASLTLSFDGSGPWSYQLTGDGPRTTTSSPVVQAVTLTEGTTYQLTSLSNVCGAGTVSGATRVTVIPTLAVQTVGATELCAGQSSSLTFVQGGKFNASTSYVVQLSDAAGSFTTPVNVGAGTQSPLPFTIGTSQAMGSGYRLRVVGNVAEKLELTPSPTFAINVKPTASIVAAGDSSVLQTYETRLRLTFTGTAPFQYTLSNGTTGNSATTTTEVVIKPDQTAVYRVSGVSNGCGVGTVSGQARITVIPLLAVEPNAPPLVTLRPNPASELVRVESNLSGPHELVLFDVAGREQLRKPFQRNTEVAVRNLGKGIHVYQIITPQGAVVGRVLVE